MKTARWLATVSPLLFLLVAPTWAGAEGWGLPSWNLLKSDSSKSSNSSLSGRKSNSSYASQRTTEPSMWSKMSAGTSSAWKKTTTTLTPWKKEKPAPARPTGIRRHAPKPEPKSTWYNPATWFPKDESAKAGPAATERPAESVSEFLNQPRVPY